MRSSKSVLQKPQNAGEIIYAKSVSLPSISSIPVPKVNKCMYRDTNLRIGILGNPPSETIGQQTLVTYSVNLEHQMHWCHTNLSTNGAIVVIVASLLSPSSPLSVASGQRFRRNKAIVFVSSASHLT